MTANRAATDGGGVAHGGRLFLCALLVLALAGPVGAVDLGFSLGVIDAFREREAIEIGAEARWREVRWGLVPHLGLHVTTDESFYAYAGLKRPFVLGAAGRWIVEPSFAVAGYEDGDGKDLGGVIEFRSGIDLLRRMPNGAALGLGAYHLSNSSIYRLNPGTNSLLLRWILPSHR